MRAIINFDGADMSFEKHVEIEALPDVGDFVRVRPGGNITTFSEGYVVPDEPLNGVVRSRSFVESMFGISHAGEPPTMSMIVTINVQQA